MKRIKTGSGKTLFAIELLGLSFWMPFVAKAEPSGTPVFSNSVRLNTRPGDSIFWRTITRPEVTLHWEWPKMAERARITVSGNGSETSRTFDNTISSCTWTFTPPTTEKTETVLSIAIAFYDASGNLLSEQIASGIGLVRGTQDNSFRLIVNGPENQRWFKTVTPHAVLPIPEGTSAFTLDAEARTLEQIPGWYLWSPISPRNPHSLMLTQNGVLREVQISGYANGTFFFVR